MRDNYRCIVTGVFDHDACKVSEEMETEARNFGITSKCECAHIIPYSYNKFRSGSEEVGSPSAQNNFEGKMQSLCMACPRIIRRMRRRKISSRERCKL